MAESHVPDLPFGDLPLSEFDSERSAVLEPHHIAGDLKVPETVVLCFFYDVLARRGDDPASGWTELGARDLENGPRTVWQVGSGAPGDADEAVAVLNPGTGGPTSVTMLEVVIAAGARTVVAVGGGMVTDTRDRQV